MFASVNQILKQTTLLTETNWNEIVSNIQVFPFRVSELHSLNKELSLSKVSFKYNIEGCETYFCRNKEIKLQPGEYLIASNQQSCEVNIDTGAKIDIGVCIDINTDCLLSGLQSFLNPNSFLNETDKMKYFLDDDFFIRYKSNAEFHRYILHLATQIKTGDFDNLQEMEFEFVRQFIFHQTSHLIAYKKVPAIKQRTRNELYEKMNDAKNMLQDSIYHDVSIASLARSLFLSEFRLYHLFKETYNISPHKFHQQLKLNEALRLYRTNQFTWTEIANKLLFADLQSFSKLFKKQFRMSPSEYSKQICMNQEMSY